MEFSKKIRKAKREPKKLRYKGDDYEVEKWAQCDICNIWRKLAASTKIGKSFLCGSVGKQCHKKEKINQFKEDYILL